MRESNEVEEEDGREPVSPTTFLASVVSPPGDSAVKSSSTSRHMAASVGITSNTETVSSSTHDGVNKNDTVTVASSCCTPVISAKL